MDDHFDICRVFEISKFDIARLTCIYNCMLKKLVYLNVCEKFYKHYVIHMVAFDISGIHSKNLIAILHLLVALARHFRAPIRMPENVYVNMVVVQVIAKKSYFC